MIKEYFVKIATFGSIGDSKLGNIISSALAIPAIYFLNFIDDRSSNLFWILAVIILLVGFFSIVTSLHSHEKQIVINSFVGTMLTFYDITFKVKFVLMGLLLFHVLCFALPLLVFTRALDNQEHEHSKIVKVILTSLAAGVFVNLFLRVAIWMVQ